MAVKRKKFKTIRWSDEEYSFIEKQSELAGVSFGRYVRQVALGERSISGERQLQSDGLKAAMVELSRIGNNINQIARVANETKLINMVRIDEIKMELREIGMKLLQEARNDK